ncbi:LptE family protein [Dysgonomonas macrotermitis]|uniref:Lipopolysaccharide-assembly n=1 Tax=Dysgonomonas macrotermitis TaxID=1346286 RepID=A0A1M4T773_9BACT|nr:LptE family protein [Dysgonomonas macrotermitis]SHE40383.1 Lipopolysaccharide-assembly [Dysgonomonas macrotermitis]
MKRFIACLAVILVVISCRVSYQFNGASIDYTKIKTLYIKDFQNQADRVNPSVAPAFNLEMRDFFTRNTKLSILSNGPADLELEGEIIRYDLMGLNVTENALAATTRLTMAVRVRYRNNVNPNEDKEETFSAYRDFDASINFTNVEEDLYNQINKEIIDQIFNATMSNW